MLFAAVVYFDHLSTLSREGQLVWHRRVDIVTLLFYLNRWTIFVWASMNAMFIFLPLQTLPVRPEFCSDNSFSSIRIYAMSQGVWPIAAGVLLLNLVPFGTNVAMEVGTRVCVIASDVIVLVVIWLKTYSTWRDSKRHGIKTPLATLLLRDGEMLLSLNILNIAGQTTNIFADAAAFSTPLSSLIITHFLLNLRQAAGEGQSDAVSSRPSFVLGPNGEDMPHRHSSPRFASFISSMGEAIGTTNESADPDMTWLDEEDAIRGGSEDKVLEKDDPGPQRV
ncbi:hypothetical protein CERSUDRAFT_101860 [Gelatoporia subvermispora B]|uniref:DUF6533 domain-containing protein n=1 Tax=Ceriporiopsis subvermispora (strain B) TaxID=914234 RepID=M2PX19_CERS8|nr:hypothetical protein CERSUDRAFT_101860 [Gelatoporia subvermispora B]